MKSKHHVPENQMSFLHILEADEITYVAKHEESYEFRFSCKVAHEMIRDSIYLMTFSRSNLQQRIDEIAWLLSDVNQDDMCSFTNCCKICSLDPYEVRAGIMSYWKRVIEHKLIMLNSNSKKSQPSQEVQKALIDSESLGYEKYKKAYYLIYPYEAAKRKAS